jgi:UDP-N-acetyl-D-glucosamine dehydrogenase
MARPRVPDRQQRVVIVGQGYVGLPLAIEAAAAGHQVVGIDIDPARVAALNAGRSPVGDISDAQLAHAIGGGYRASADFDVVAGADVVVICVPTPYHDDKPDLSHMESAAESIAPHLTAGSVVILESTTYPGTTEELLLPLLEAGSGLRCGDEFDLAFSPERIDPGNPTYGLRNTPKIVGGMTERATDRAASFYGSFVDVVHRVSGPKAAEMAKLLENTFRHINIALVNELAILAEGLDVDIWEVIEAAATKPFGFMPFHPGPGVGGHCIPVDPMYLSWRVRQFGGAAKFIDLARDVNDAMPAYCVSRVQDLLNDRSKPLRGSKILVIGVAYKADISDMRESPALPLLDALLERGAGVSYHDPHVPSLRLAHGELRSVELTDERLSQADCVVVVTAHRSIDFARVGKVSGLVFDTRNVVPRGDGVFTL